MPKPLTRAQSAELYSVLAETMPEPKTELAYHSPYTLLVAVALSAQATEDWILSPSHRDNLLEPVYDVAGVGVAVDTDRVFITMLYAKPQIDAASARLASIYDTPPADLYGLTEQFPLKIEYCGYINGATDVLRKRISRVAAADLPGLNSIRDDQRIIFVHVA